MSKLLKNQTQLFLFVILCLTIVVNVVNAQDESNDVSTTVEPTAIPTTVEPTAIPTTVEPTAIPTTVEPTAIPTTVEPTIIPTTQQPELDQLVEEVVISEPIIIETPIPTEEPNIVVDTTEEDTGSATIIETVTVVPSLDVDRTEPSTFTNGINGTLSVIGDNFTEITTVRLIGYGYLQTTYFNATALTAVLPSTLSAGTYSIEVSDPTHGTEISSNTLRVYAEDIEATAIPGQPTLVIRNYVTSPASIFAGDTTTLTFDVYNAGTYTAEGVIVSLGNSDFAPANGQASLALSNISLLSSQTVSLSVTASATLTEGIAIIPITMSYRDENGATYTSDGNVSVMIIEEEQGDSQIILDSYLITPNPAYPGDSVIVQALFRNTGTETAKQVLVQLGDGALLAGSQGNAFTLGDMLAGSTVPITMPLVVSSDVDAGLQSQLLNISYLQDGESETSTASMSIEVEELDTESPILLLQSYSTSDEELVPGQRFTLDLTLFNAGSVDMSDMMLSFGSINTTSSSSDDSVTTTTTADSNFSPNGDGGTIVIGDIFAGESHTIQQEFIANNDLDNGVYSLKLSVQYEAENIDIEQTFNASLIVNTPPLLRITQDNELENPLTVGETYTLGVNIANLGDDDVTMTDMSVTGVNISITDGETVLLEPLSGDDDTLENIEFTALECGTYSLQIDVHYIDDLNQVKAFSAEFVGEIEDAPAPTERRQIRQVEPEPEEENENLLGRVLLGVLGLGG